MSDDDVQGMPDNNDKNPPKEEQIDEEEKVLDPLADPSLLDDDDSESVFDRDEEDDGYCDEDYCDEDKFHKFEKRVDALLESIKETQKESR